MSIISTRSAADPAKINQLFEKISKSRTNAKSKK